MGPAPDLVRQAAEIADVEVQLVAANLPAGAPMGEVGEERGRFPVLADAGTGGTATLPFHIDSVGLVGTSRHTFLLGLTELFSIGFAITVGIVCALLLFFGVLFWLAERSRNDEVAKDGNRLAGIGQGFWWAGVTATTIGYGDLVPRTFAGRSIAMVWMLFSMALTALLTAYIVSLTGGASQATDFAEAVEGERIGYVAGGALDEGDLAGANTVRSYPTLEGALAALDAEELDAVAHPYQLAKAQAEDRDLQRTTGSIVLPVFVLPQDSELRRAIDRIITTPAWQARMEQAFGGD
jgi:hypothetical protein